MIRPIILAATMAAATSQAHAADTARNLAVVRQAFDAWTEGRRTVFDLLTPDMTWTIEGSSSSAGTYDRAGLDALLEPFNANLAAPLAPRLRELFADGSTVIALFDATAPLKNGRTYHNSYAWFLTMNGERISAVTAFLDLAAFDSAREGR